MGREEGAFPGLLFLKLASSARSWSWPHKAVWEDFCLQRSLSGPSSFMVIDWAGVEFAPPGASGTERPFAVFKDHLSHGCQDAPNTKCKNQSQASQGNTFLQKRLPCQLEEASKGQPSSAQENIDPRIQETVVLCLRPGLGQKLKKGL